MKIVVALDKFKGSLTAPAACDIVRRGLLAALPDATIIVKPMADGGDGTAKALIAARNGEWISREVAGPLPGQRVIAGYGWFATDRSAVIEMATASGLALLRDNERNPLLTTTQGTGELIAAAMVRGAKKILLAVGGSATVDGGVGAATALGWRFLDAQGKLVNPCGGDLSRLVTIKAPTRPLPEIEVLCDVENPLCGPNGAAHIFGPQKGATPAMVEQLDANLRHLADLVKTQLQKDILDLSGSGAAGGLAGGAIAFMNARLARGVDTVMAASGLAEAMTGADWIITGEGQFDEQSLHGKVVDGITKLARQSGTKVAVLAGRVKLDELAWRQAGLEFAHPIAPETMITAEALQRSEPLLFTAAKELGLALQ